VTGTDFEAMLASANAQIKAVQDLTSQMATLRGVGEAADGKVRAEVAPAGMLTGLTIEPKALRMSSEELAEAILAASRAAGEDANERLGKLLEQAVPGAGAGIADLVGGSGDQSNPSAAIDEVIESIRKGL
jgi:DNA-binding protein YbaB